jgi:high-affinity iron transporter
MIGALIIVFREIIEAGLIIGIVWAVARNLTAAKNWILGGIGAGLLGSVVVAVFTGAIANAFAGYGQELFNAAILGTAVAMLAWHNMWMAKHGREMAMGLKQAGEDAVAGRKSFYALAVIVALAVLREGSEVVLFLYGVAISGNATAGGILAGGLIGLLAGGVVSMLTYKGLLRIHMRYFFLVTNWLITLLAAGMAAQMVGYLQQAGAVTVLDATLWDTSGVLSESSLIGRVLHTLVGYMDQPSVLQALAYAAVVLAMWGGSRMMSAYAPKIPAARPSAAE